MPICPHCGEMEPWSGFGGHTVRCKRPAGYDKGPSNWTPLVGSLAVTVLPICIVLLIWLR
jgi:hypothetical protein